MIFDSHMHVGSFESMFGVSLDRDGIDELMREHGIGNGVVFYPDNEYVREVVESIPGLYGLVWGNPRVPGWLDHVSLLNLDVRGAKVDLSIVRHTKGVAVSVLRNDDSVDVVFG